MFCLDVSEINAQEEFTSLLEEADREKTDYMYADERTAQARFEKALDLYNDIIGTAAPISQQLRFKAMLHKAELLFEKARFEEDDTYERTITSAVKLLNKVIGAPDEKREKSDLVNALLLSAEIMFNESKFTTAMDNINAIFRPDLKPSDAQRFRAAFLAAKLANAQPDIFTYQKAKITEIYNDMFIALNHMNQQEKDTCIDDLRWFMNIFLIMRVNFMRVLMYQTISLI